MKRSLAFLAFVPFFFTACSNKSFTYNNTLEKSTYIVSKRYCIDSKLLLSYSKENINTMLEKEVKQDTLFDFLNETSFSNDSYEELLSINRVNIDKEDRYYTDDFDNYCIDFQVSVSNPSNFFEDINLEEYAQAQSDI